MCLYVYVSVRFVRVRTSYVHAGLSVAIFRAYMFMSGSFVSRICAAMDAHRNACLLYVCRYVCMYVCRYGCLFVHRCMSGCLDVCLYVCMSVCVAKGNEPVSPP